MHLLPILYKKLMEKKEFLFVFWKTTTNPGSPCRLPWTYHSAFLASWPPPVPGLSFFFGLPETGITWTRWSAVSKTQMADNKAKQLLLRTRIWEHSSRASSKKQKNKPVVTLSSHISLQQQAWHNFKWNIESAQVLSPVEISALHHCKQKFPLFGKLKGLFVTLYHGL